MRWPRLKLDKGILGRPGKAFLLLALFLSVLTLANFPSLHKAVHPNAGNPDHQCAVKLLASGQVEANAGVVALIIAAVLICGCFQETPAPILSFLHLPPGRGPPAHFA